jgi:enamine deaminase RidA (YjgF/YER057c/UK114 family)
LDKQQVNPWTWQDQLGFSQAWRVDGAQTVVFLSGQAPISAQGDLIGKGDFEAQTRQVFENLRSVLEQAGTGFDSIVKVTVYVTDTSRLRDYIPGPQPASTAIGVASLALEGMMIEVEATAVL